MRLEHVSKAGGRGPVVPGFATSVADSPSGSDIPGPSSNLATTIVELAPDGILIVDPDGVISFANPAAGSIFGYSIPELLGLPVEALVPECLRAVHARHRDGYKAAPQPRPMGWGRDLMARRCDGTEVPVDISLSPVSLDGRAATIAVVREVAGRRDSETELRRRILVQEDERIATQLNDRVVKRLFLAGMKIQSVLQLTDHPVAQRLAESVDQLDTVIREIRHTVFAGALPDAGEDTPGPLRG